MRYSDVWIGAIVALPRSPDPGVFVTKVVNKWRAGHYNFEAMLLEDVFRKPYPIHGEMLRRLRPATKGQRFNYHMNGPFIDEV